MPAAEFARLKVPVAIFQGNTDMQVQVSEAKRLAEAKPDAELHVIAGMDHVLKLVPPDSRRQLASYSDPTLPLSAELARQLAVVLRQRCGPETARADSA